MPLLFVEEAKLPKVAKVLGECPRLKIVVVLTKVKAGTASSSKDKLVAVSNGYSAPAEVQTACDAAGVRLLAGVGTNRDGGERLLVLRDHELFERRLVELRDVVLARQLLLRVRDLARGALAAHGHAHRARHEALRQREEREEQEPHSDGGKKAHHLPTCYLRSICVGAE